MSTLFSLIFYTIIILGLMSFIEMVLDVIKYFLDKNVERLQAEKRRLEKQKGEN